MQQAVPAIAVVVVGTLFKGDVHAQLVWCVAEGHGFPRQEQPFLDLEGL